jgi:hypothetical protein
VFLPIASGAPSLLVLFSGTLMLTLAPVVLMVLVFLHQRWRMYTVHQNPWKGGGFGMFSDLYRNSVVPTLWVSGAAMEQVPLRLESTEWMSRVNAVPSRRNIHRWGDELLRGRWRCCGDRVHPLPAFSSERPLIVSRVSLVHLVVSFDAASGLHSGRPERTYSIEARGDRRRTADA